MKNSMLQMCRTLSLAAMCLMLPVTALSKSITLDIRPGEGVTDQRKLSDYFAPLKDTNLDTDVFILDSGRPGVTALLLGGTHGNELAGTVSALIVLENVVVKTGKLVVIPYANHSAISMKDTRNHIAQRHRIQSRSGERHLVYGDRRTDPDDQQAEDPEVYKNPMGYELKNGAESRNLNRTYPGRPDGTLTERASYAIIALVRQEQVDISLDMHEADTPEKKIQTDGDYRPGGNKRLAYTLVSHPRGLEIAAYALLGLEEDINI
ncbi:MAG: deacylase, partial [Gammaproteobacteria bacterium]|nr:deacylase [Gammaproteobacteria bacterium]